MTTISIRDMIFSLQLCGRGVPGQQDAARDGRELRAVLQHVAGAALLPRPQGRRQVLRLGARCVEVVVQSKVVGFLRDINTGCPLRLSLSRFFWH